ncbi:hypothetical protein [Streptomyces sp. NPDC001635]
MWALGLYRSVVLVPFLPQLNPVQEAAAELFGVSQPTVSRRWTGLLPVVKEALAEHVPDPPEASDGRVVLVDGTPVTTWDWASQGNALFSGEHPDTGFNLQIAATLAGDLPAISSPGTFLPSPHPCPAAGTTSTPGSTSPSARSAAPSNERSPTSRTGRLSPPVTAVL